MDSFIIGLVKVCGCVTILALTAGSVVWGVDKWLGSKGMREITWRVVQEYWKERDTKSKAGDTP